MSSASAVEGPPATRAAPKRNLAGLSWALQNANAMSDIDEVKLSNWSYPYISIFLLLNSLRSATPQQQFDVDSLFA